jgi:hypothetical protein
LKTQLVGHDKESVDCGSQRTNVVEPIRISGRTGVGVHGHLVVGIRAVESGGNLGYQIGAPSLISAASAFEVKVHAIEIFGLDGPDQRLGEGSWSCRGRSELVERRLVEVARGQNDTVTGSVGSCYQVGQFLTLVAIPPGS